VSYDKIIKKKILSKGSLISMKKTLSITYTALCTAIISVCSLISVPLPSGVPITMQTFAVSLSGFILGKKKGAVAVLIYIILGSFGIPVFSGFRGGLSVLTGITGGFLSGFIITSFLCGLSTQTDKKVLKALLIVSGVICLHLIGCIQFSLLTSSSLLYAFITVSAPFIAKDIISVIIAQLIYKKLKFYLKTDNFK